MCGIAGIISLNQKQNQYLPHLYRMAISMKKRGPDDAGYMIASGFTEIRASGLVCKDSMPQTFMQSDNKLTPLETSFQKPGSVFLAHRRLSILDPSFLAHQPMATADHRYWLTYNGEIYNYQALKQTLIKLGYIFKTQTDSEIVLAAYQIWGQTCVEQFNGMFAFAIWDDIEKTLFCARDRIGEKPFYYTIQDNVFIFASDITALIASGLYQPSVNDEGLYHCLSFGVAPRPMTAFGKVMSLEQAHTLTIHHDGKITKRRYWNIETGKQPIYCDERLSTEQLEYHINQAVKSRMVADVPLGTFMSGGIDSSLISAICAKNHPGIKAFTLSFPEAPEMNELQQARSTASMYSMDHLIKEVRGELKMDDILNMVRCYEEPFYDISPNYVLSSFVAENNVKVILNGLGGDELFAGYSYYRWIGRWKLLQKIKPLLKIGKGLPIASHLCDRLHDIAHVNTPDRFAVAIRTFLTEEDKTDLFLRNTNDFNSIEKVHHLYVDAEREFTSPLQAISYIDLMHYIGNHHVYRVDKFTMEFSLEARLPYLDHQLIDFAFACNDDLKIKQGVSKYLLRKVAAQYIHPTCLSMKKKGFDLPTDKLMKGELFDLIFVSLLSLSNRGIFKEHAIKRIHKEWLKGMRTFRGVWQLVSVELWLQEFIDKKPSALTDSIDFHKEVVYV